MLRHNETRQYRKLYDEEEAKRATHWQPVVVRSEDREALCEVAEALKDFKGCFVKADAILTRLALVVPPPGFSLVVWGENWMWFRIGTCVAISLPCEDPGLA